MRTGTGEALIGKTIRIMNRRDWHYGCWATIVSFDGEFYHVALHTDPNTVLELARNDFWVMRGQRG
jgi:hypothetical protein